MFASIFSFSQGKYSNIERLYYTGYYNWGFLWVKAGLVDITVTKSDKYPNSVKVEAVGLSSPSWDWIFRLRDTLITHFDENSYYPYHAYRVARENNYHKTFEYIWDYQNNRVLADIHRIGKWRRQDTIPLKPQTYDMLSIVWKVREVDYDRYEKGDTIPIKLLIDDQIYDLYVRYLGTETIKLEKQKIECYVFSPLLVEGEVFKKGENMKIWLTKDEERMPVMVEAKILIGSIKGILDPARSIYEKRNPD